MRIMSLAWVLQSSRMFGRLLRCALYRHSRVSTNNFCSCLKVPESIASEINSQSKGIAELLSSLLLIMSRMSYEKFSIMVKILSPDSMYTVRSILQKRFQFSIVFPLTDSRDAHRSAHARGRGDSFAPVMEN